MDYKSQNKKDPKERIERVESEIVDYRRIFYGGNTDGSDSASGGGEAGASVPACVSADRKQEREKRFVRVFFTQMTVCLLIIATVLTLKYTRPETFERVSSALSGFYENNITLSDLTQLLDERISNNDALATFFNFTPGQD